MNFTTERRECTEVKMSLTVHEKCDFITISNQFEGSALVKISLVEIRTIYFVKMFADCELMLKLGSSLDGA